MASLIAVPGYLVAAGPLIEFFAGDPIAAGDVNANFSWLDGRVAANETDIAALQAALAALPVCGNGIPEAGEGCDDGAQTATCDADCTPVACGDGTLNLTAGEICDDGNTVNGDGCDADCRTCPGGGVAVGGSCWHATEGGDYPSCNDICTLRGLSYDDATRTYAGDLGTNARCEEVLDALGLGTGPVFGTEGGSGAGCYFVPSTLYRARITNVATDGGDGSSFYVRACACS